MIADILEVKMIKLRDYQEEALGAWLKAWDRKVRNAALEGRFFRPVLHLATGAGKTVIFTEGIKRLSAGGFKRTILLAHTQELIFQMFEKFNVMWSDMPPTFDGKPVLGIEMAHYSAPDAWIIVATRQTLINRLEKIAEHGKVEYIVVDECHHVSPDNSYQTIIDFFSGLNPSLRVVGFTATPERSDRLSLAANFDGIEYVANIEYLMERGFLVPASRIVRGIDVDLESVKTVAGDYSQGDLITKLNSAKWVDHAVSVFFELVHKKRSKTLAFFPSVQMSKDFARRIRLKGVNVHHIDSDTPDTDRKVYLDSFRYGDCSVLTNVMVLTEGVDLPMTDCVFNMRPTKSSTLYTQIVGRGLRPSENTGKTDLLIVELAGRTDVMLFGDLIGKVRTCSHCKAKYWLGSKRCPQCGSSTFEEINEGGAEEKTALSLRTWETMYDVAVGAHKKSLFKKSRANWFSDEKGRLSVGAGRDCAYMILPPTGFDIEENLSAILSFSKGDASVSEEMYRKHLFYVERATKFSLFRVQLDQMAGRKTCVMLRASHSLEELMTMADTDARKLGGILSDKKADWMRKAATEPQKKLLRNLGLPIPTDIRAGQAAKLITHTLTKKMVKEYVMAHYPKTKEGF